MKKLLLAALLLTTIFISCKTGGKGTPHKFKLGSRDTVSTIIVFKVGTGANYSAVEKIYVDTIKYKFSDTLHDGKEKKEMRDSFYILTVVRAIDTATARVQKIPLKDSAGNPTPFAYKYFVANDAVIWDANISLNEMVKRVATDTTKKTDTTHK